MLLKEVGTLDGHSEEVWSVAWNPSGTFLASSGTDKTIRLWQKEANERWVSASSLTDGHNRTIRSVAFSPCGKFIASTSFDATIVIWVKKESEFEVLSTLEGHENEVKRAAFSPSGQFLASCSRDKSVWVWEMDEEDDFTCCSILQVHSQDVKFVAWHPKCDILASCSYDNSVKFFKYDGDDWTEYQSLDNAHQNTVWCLAFNPQGDKIVTCSQDGGIKIWQLYPPNSSPENGKWTHVATIEGDIHKGPVYHVDWSDFIATACRDNCIRIFKESVSEGASPIYELIHTEHEAHSQDVNCVKWNPSVSGLLASCSDDGLVKLWQLDQSQIS